MAFSSFLLLAMKDVLHHKSRMVGGIFGVLIAVAFITASAISVESISERFFSTELAKLDYHYLIEREDWSDPEGMDDTNIDADKWGENISKLDGVERVDCFVETNFQVLNETTISNIMGVSNETAAMIYGEAVVLPTGGFDAIITSLMASELGLSSGDEFEMTFWTMGGKFPWGMREPAIGMVNITFTVLSIKDPIDGPRNYGGFHTMTMSMQGLRSFIARTFNESVSYPYALRQYMEVRISEDYLDDVDDPDGTQIQFKRMTMDLGSAVSGTNYKVTQNKVQNVYEDYVSWSWTMRIVFVVLTVPLLLISFYLLSAGSRVGMEDRIREIGLLKIKGATRGQVAAVLLIESFLYGVIGGALGLFIGSALSLLFDSRLYGLTGQNDSYGPQLPVPGPILIVIALIVVPILLLLMRIVSTSKLSKLPLLEALGRANVVESQKTYKPYRDLIFFLITALIIGGTLYFNIRSPSGFMGRIAYSLLFIVSPLAILFLPFVLILTLSRLLILGTNGVLDLMSNIGRFIVKDLFPIIKANMHFHRKRIATLTILVTAVISFGILVSSLHATRSQDVERTISTSIPSDLIVMEEGSGQSQLDNVSTAGGVSWTVEVDTHSWMNVMLSQMYMVGGKLIAIDSRNYTQLIDFPDEAIIEGKGPEALSSPGIVPMLINEELRKYSGLSVGDEVSMSDEWKVINEEEPKTEFVIVGIVSYLPGARSTIDEIILTDPGSDLDLMELKESACMYIDIERNPLNITPLMRSYLVNVDGDEGQAERSLEGIRWNGTNHAILSRDREIQNAKEDTTFTSIEMLLFAEYAFVIVAVTVGVLLFMTVSISSRRREFAEMMARGCTRSEVMRIVLSEGAVVAVTGLILGTGIGILTAYTFQHLFSGGSIQNLPSIGESDETTSIVMGTSVVIPLSVSLLHILAFVSVMGASTVVSWFASKVDIASSLRLRTS